MNASINSWPRLFGAAALLLAACSTSSTVDESESGPTDTGDISSVSDSPGASSDTPDLPPSDTPDPRPGDSTEPPPSDISVGPDDVAPPGECLTEATYFECAVWDPFMGSTCLTCHQPGGVGAAQSAFELLVDDLPANLERVRTIAENTDGTEPVILQKVRGEGHGGGAILPEGSPEYENLVALLAYFDDPSFCRPTCDGHVELIEEATEICSAPPVTDQLDATRPTAVPPIHTQRLTHWQYRAVVSKAFDKYNDVTEHLPPDSTTGTIPSNENYDLPTVDYTRYAVAAVEVVDTIMGQAQSTIDELFACPDPASPDRACAEAFIVERGMRLFRRPLTEAEVSAYLELFDIGGELAAGKDDFEVRMQYVIEALVQSPDVLYQIEIGPVDSPEPVRLSGLEIATRLSFFLQARPPTDALLSAALAGELDDDSGVAQWADTLLADVGQSRIAIQQFIMRWLRLDDAHAVEKDLALYPDFTAEVLRDLRHGDQLWAAYTVLVGDGQLETLFSAAETVVRFDDDENLFWGAEAADILVETLFDKAHHGSLVQLPASERAGLLTSPVRLANAHNSDDTVTRPILRGAAVLKNVLCGTLVPPQAFEPPKAAEGQSVKDSASYMLTSPGCAGCHNVINPLGLAFETYDATGAYRHDGLDDLGYPIETDGSYGVDGVCSEETAPFADAVDLIKSLATNDQLRACATIQWFRYGLRRGPRLDGADAGNLAEIFAAFAAEDFHVPTLLKAIALSEPFLHRTFGESEVTP